MKGFISVLFLSTFIFVSCSMEDDGDTPLNEIDAALIVGTWSLDDTDIDASTNLDVVGQTVSTNVNTSLVSTNVTITFNADGTYSATGTSTFVTTALGVGDETTTSDISGTSGTYVITGNTIVFSEDFLAGSLDGQADDLVTRNYAISTLTASDLIIQIDGEADQEVAGQPYTIVVDGFAGFTK
jgi:hypothetical protein